MLACAFCLCMGQFIWKRSDSLLLIAVGFVIYGMGAIAMLAAYRFGSLSVLQPINSVSYIVSAVLGAIFFNEPLTILKLVGIALIMAGVVILARPED